ncbi:MAG: HNH endonuclease [Planctomycetaceae bacterium]|jgi:DNA-directed RNA polymerase subunit RPC12/RpoP|nr:HNH endonuclease [Planctomycetaceae bacterium]
MKSIEIDTVREKIYCSYSNLAMAHSAVTKQQEKYDKLNYMIRAKLYKGLTIGTINMRTIFDDEKIKLETGQVCNYCGSHEQLSLDHILPQKYGGKDDAENLIYACKKCNSSKGKKDLMEWMQDKNDFLPLMIIRRYLKLIYNYCDNHNLLDLKINELKDMNLPFNINCLPMKFPEPQKLKLTICNVN